MDLYGLYANPWMFPPTSQRGNDFAAAMFHRTADFGADSLRMLSHVGFGVSSPFLYSYHAITQKGSLGNDFQRHLQNSNMIKTDVRNFMQKVMPANQNSRGYQTSSMITTGTLDGIALGSAAAAGYQFINKAASFTNNALTAMENIRLKPTNVNTAEMFPTNRLHSGLDVKQMLKSVKKYTSSKNLFAKDFNTKISGYTKHGLSQVIGRDNGRGVAIKSILDAAKNPVKIIKTKNNTYQIIGKEATIVLNSRGKVVTAWGKPRNFKK